MESRKDIPVSDREKAGLRGPVKTCTEETTVKDSDGTEGKFSDTTEYDASGRIIATHGSNPKGMEWSSTREYDAQGRLLRSAGNQMGNTNETINTYDRGGRRLKAIEKRAGATFSETTYAYDAGGRVVDITTKGEMASHSVFQYDEQGLKTRTQTFDREPVPPNFAFGGTPMLAAEIGHGVPPGGHVTTIYDQHDRPTEAQIYDAAGHVVSRMVARYDADGRVIDERQVLDDPASIIPPEVRDQLLKQAGRSIEELRAYLGSLLGGKQSGFGQSTKYDAQGRVTEVRTTMFAGFEQVVTTMYNDHGETATEETTTTNPAAFTEKPDGVPRTIPPPPRHYEARYEYRYDGFGNWTERTTKYRDNPDEPSKGSSTAHRTITYY